jgi:molybdopterin biosynthesis enzyme MoaB
MLSDVYRAAVITVSDKGSKGDREDTSGKLVKEILESHKYKVVSYTILPDEQSLLEN